MHSLQKIAMEDQTWNLSHTIFFNFIDVCAINTKIATIKSNLQQDSTFCFKLFKVVLLFSSPQFTLLLPSFSPKFISSFIIIYPITPGLPSIYLFHIVNYTIFIIIFEQPKLYNMLTCFAGFCNFPCPCRLNTKRCTIGA